MEYKLFHFSGKGQGTAETSRMLFALANIDFHDIRFSSADWELRYKKESPFGISPYLQVLEEGKVIATVSQSHAINRFLFRTLNLVPNGRIKEAQVHMIANCIEDYCTKQYVNCPSIEAVINEADSARKSELKKLYKENTLIRGLDLLEDFLKRNNATVKEPWFGGKTLSWADLSFRNWMQYVEDYLDILPPLNNYPNLKILKMSVENHPQISQYLKDSSPPCYMLFHFDGKDQGRVETARMLFRLAGVDYEDIRFPRSEWCRLYRKVSPFGMAPFLQIIKRGNVIATICQSHAINRYLARTFNLAGISGREEAQVHAIANCVDDYCTQQYVNCPALHMVENEFDLNIKWEMRREYAENTLKRGLELLEDYLSKKNSCENSPWFVGSKMTWADLLFRNWMVHVEVLHHIIPPLDGYPRLKKLMKEVENDDIILRCIADEPMDMNYNFESTLFAL